MYFIEDEDVNEKRKKYCHKVYEITKNHDLFPIFEKIIQVKRMTNRNDRWFQLKIKKLSNQKFIMQLEKEIKDFKFKLNVYSPLETIDDYTKFYLEIAINEIFNLINS